jgi:hypothetical protein
MINIDLIEIINVYMTKSQPFNLKTMVEIWKFLKVDSLIYIYIYSWYISIF